MSDWNPGAGPRADDSGGTYEPADESAASVFGRPAPPGGPGPQPPPAGAAPFATPPHPMQPGAPGGPGVDRPPGPPSGFGEPTQVHGGPPGPQAPPGSPYRHGPPANAPTRPQPGPARQAPGTGQRPPGTRPRERGGPPGGGDQGARPSRSGSGLPFGFGALIGTAGLVCFLVALFVLPWFTVAGQDVVLSDLRSAATAEEAPEDDGSLTDGALPGAADGIPSADEVTGAVEQQARDAASRAVTAAVDSGRARYLELYTGPLALVVSGAVALAVLFSTILSPRSTAASMLLGFRRISGVVTVLAAAAHSVALWLVFTGDGAPTPAPGVWIGVGGLAAVLLGCIVGPKK